MVLPSWAHRLWVTSHSNQEGSFAWRTPNLECLPAQLYRESPGVWRIPLNWRLNKTRWTRVEFNWFLLKVKVAQLCSTFCDSMDCTVHGILWAKILEWVVYPSSRGSSQSRDRTRVSCIAGRVFTNRLSGKLSDQPITGLSPVMKRLSQEVWLPKTCHCDPPANVTSYP